MCGWGRSLDHRQMKNRWETEDSRNSEREDGESQWRSLGGRKESMLEEGLDEKMIWKEVLGRQQIVEYSQ